MESLIRWKKGDYIKLGRAISQFNKTINEIQVDESVNIPKIMDYKEVKSNILSRKELNRVINSLKSASVENLTNIKEFPSGEKVTEWEYGEISKASRRALNRLQREKESILSSRPSIGMGDERLSEIRAIEDSISRISEKRNREFSRVKKRIMRLGEQDLALKKAETFRENFYTALEHLSNYTYYPKLKSQLDRIKNPIKFYDYVSKSPQLMDIFLYYLDPDTNIYGAFSSNEEALNSSLMFHLGIDINE